MVYGGWWNGGAYVARMNSQGSNRLQYDRVRKQQSAGLASVNCGVEATIRTVDTAEKNKNAFVDLLLDKVIVQQTVQLRPQYGSVWPEKEWTFTSCRRTTDWQIRVVDEMRPRQAQDASEAQRVATIEASYSFSRLL